MRFIGEAGGGRGHEKLIYRRELTKKGGLGQFADLEVEGLRKKEGRMFLRGVERGDTPMHTMNLPITNNVLAVNLK